mgnify:CR=1 FL=1
MKVNRQELLKKARSTFIRKLTEERLWPLILQHKVNLSDLTRFVRRRVEAPRSGEVGHVHPPRDCRDPDADPGRGDSGQGIRLSGTRRALAVVRTGLEAVETAPGADGVDLAAYEIGRAHV